jgi:hypothetical protein
MKGKKIWYASINSKINIGKLIMNYKMTEKSHLRDISLSTKEEKINEKTKKLEMLWKKHEEKKEEREIIRFTKK